eukprot:SAG31_NODE_12080_length_970_cov_1.363949_1_plen_20_part_01
MALNFQNSTYPYLRFLVSKL